MLVDCLISAPQELYQHTCDAFRTHTKQVWQPTNATCNENTRFLGPWSKDLSHTLNFENLSHSQNFQRGPNSKIWTGQSTSNTSLASLKLIWGLGASNSRISRGCNPTTQKHQNFPYRKYCLNKYFYSRPNSKIWTGQSTSNTSLVSLKLILGLGTSKSRISRSCNRTTFLNWEIDLTSTRMYSRILIFAQRLTGYSFRHHVVNSAGGWSSVFQRIFSLTCVQTML